METTPRPGLLEEQDGRGGGRAGRSAGEFAGMAGPEEVWVRAPFLLGLKSGRGR